MVDGRICFLLHLEGLKLDGVSRGQKAKRLEAFIPDISSSGFNAPALAETRVESDVMPAAFKPNAKAARELWMMM